MSFARLPVLRHGLSLGEVCNLIVDLGNQAGITLAQDDTLAFRRYCCALFYCNSCLMLVNGKKVNACLYILEPDTELEIAPIPGKRVLRDLMVEENVLYC